MTEAVDSRKFLVTGATGSIGKATLDVLDAAKIPTIAYSRSEVGDLHGHLPFVTTLQGDLSVPQLRDAMEEVTDIIHLAGSLEWGPPKGKGFEEVKRVNVAGTANVLQAAEDTRVERLVFASSIAYYGVQDGNIVEDSPPMSKDRYGISKALAEEELKKASKVDVRIVRPAPLLGKDVQWWSSQLYNMFRYGAPFVVGNGSGKIPIVDADDVARGLVFVASENEASGQTYNLVADRHPTQEEIAEAYNLLFRLKRTYPLPHVAANLLGGILDWLAVKTSFEPPFTSELIQAAQQKDWHVSNSKIRELGFSFKPAEQTLEETVLWIDQEKKLGRHGVIVDFFANPHR